MAVLILAMGIGGTTAVFSVADKVLLNPIPGRDTDRLISVREVDTIHADQHWHSSPPVIAELATHTNEIAAVTYSFQSYEDLKLQVGDTTMKIRGAKVAPNFFDVFGLSPLMGRTFLTDEGGKGAEKVIVLGHGFWKEYFGGDPAAVGGAIELNGEVYTVVGIMPSNVRFPFGPGYSQFWVPYVFEPEQLQAVRAMDRVWMTTAKLRDGVSLSNAQALFDVVAARRAETVNGPNQNWTIQATPASESFSGEQLRKTLWILLSMMGALLLIACANVGNILLSRALSRQGEFGIRMAVGAGRTRIARQMLVESLALAGMAAALGVFMAWGGIVALERFYLTALPRINVIGLDWQVLGIACLVSTVVGILFGAAPAWIAARTNVNHALKESAQRHSGGVLQRTFHDGLVVIQVGVAVVLLTGAGLMTRSAVMLLRVDPGLEADNLYRVYYDAIDFMNTPAYDFKAAMARGVPKEQASKEAWAANVDRQLRFRRTALERLRAVPGVEFVAVNEGLGFSDFNVEGKQTPVYLGRAAVDVVEGDYLRTIGAKLLAGRLLVAEDAQPGRREVVINRELSSICWGGQNPLGRRIQSTDDPDAYVVVGVIENIRDWRLSGDARAGFYEPYERVTKSMAGGVGDYVIRSSLDPEALREGVARAGKEFMAPLEVRDFYSIKSKLYASTISTRVMMWLLLSLAGLGLLLSALGIYAVLAYSVARRTREVGIRMAVGADRGRIRSLFMRRGVRLIVNGLVLGIVGAITAGQYIRSLLYKVEPVDPWSLAAVVLILGTVGGIACWLPARQAAAIEPMEALRSE